MFQPVTSFAATEVADEDARCGIGQKCLISDQPINERLDDRGTPPLESPCLMLDSPAVYAPSPSNPALPASPPSLITLAHLSDGIILEV